MLTSGAFKITGKKISSIQRCRTHVKSLTKVPFFILGQHQKHSDTTPSLFLLTQMGIVEEVFFCFFFKYLMFVVEMKCLLSLIVYLHLWASGQSSRVPILGAPGGAQQRLFFRTFNPFWFLALNAMTKWWGAIFPRPSSSTWPMKT